MVRHVVRAPREHIVFRERNLNGEELPQGYLDLRAFVADVDALRSQPAVVLHTVGSGEVGENRAVSVDTERTVVGTRTCDRGGSGVSRQNTVHRGDRGCRAKEAGGYDAFRRPGELADILKERTVSSVDHTSL